MQQSRLKWQCRRGMRELDVLLSRFLEHQYAAASQPEKAAFEALLTLSDPELVRYLLHGEPCPQTELQCVIDRLRDLD